MFYKMYIIYEIHMGPILRGGSIYFVGQNIRHRTASMHKQAVSGGSHACRRRPQVSEMLTMRTKHNET